MSSEWKIDWKREINWNVAVLVFFAISSTPHSSRFVIDLLFAALPPLGEAALRVLFEMCYLVETMLFYIVLRTHQETVHSDLFEASREFQCNFPGLTSVKKCCDHNANMQDRVVMGAFLGLAWIIILCRLPNYFVGGFDALKERFRRRDKTE